MQAESMKYSLFLFHAVTQLPPVTKLPVEKPTLQKLAVIPLEESQWYILGQALGLKEGLLKSIQHGTSNPTKHKREMFKNWLKEKDTKVSWQVLLGALRKIGATDVAEVVRSEYGISDDSEDDVDAGFSEVCCAFNNFGVTLICIMLHMTNYMYVDLIGVCVKVCGKGKWGVGRGVGRCNQHISTPVHHQFVYMFA